MIVSKIFPISRFQVAEEVIKLIYQSYEDRPPFQIDEKDLVETPGVWKLNLEDGKNTSGIIYRKHFGLKIRYVFHDGTDFGKGILKEMLLKDLNTDYHWSEVSGPLERFLLKHNICKVHSGFASYLLQKEITMYHENEFHYDRDVSLNDVRTQCIMGKPNLEELK